MKGLDTGNKNAVNQKNEAEFCSSNAILKPRVQNFKTGKSSISWEKCFYR
jgi:hypothetical protein